MDFYLTKSSIAGIIVQPIGYTVDNITIEIRLLQLGKIWILQVPTRGGGGYRSCIRQLVSRGFWWYPGTQLNSTATSFQKYLQIIVRYSHGVYCSCYVLLH